VLPRHRAVIGPRRARVLAGALAGLLLLATGGVAVARLYPGPEAPRPVPQPTPSGPAAARPPLPASTPPPVSARLSRAEVPTTDAPAFAARVPGRTSQVVRTVTSRRWCALRWCTTTQAWRKRADGSWRLLRSFRSTIGPNGFGKRREGDMRSPRGVYRIEVTFSTGERSPGAMPWRRRLPTSTVTGQAGRLYNTWIEQPGRADGDRPSMRYGFWVAYNRPRLRVGVGPRPVPDRGSGIFYHTSRPGQRWIPTEGCTQVGNPRSMRWILRWLRPQAHPRVVQDL
jgi:L,D-peptidoglycan transpeptidase YkuD (ErfK/YbiS/YcfS/YnhG family)